LGRGEIVFTLQRVCGEQFILEIVLDIVSIDSYQSPCGKLILGSYKGRLCLCDWENRKNRNRMEVHIAHFLKATFMEGESEVIASAKQQLQEFFLRGRKIMNIPLLLVGTDFQKSVWERLMQVQYGETLSYKMLANSLGYVRSVRAVANAVASNPISIFIPCHRIVGSNHTLTGYAGGLDAKCYLLELERKVLRGELL